MIKAIILHQDQEKLLLQNFRKWVRDLNKESLLLPFYPLYIEIKEDISHETIKKSSLILNKPILIKDSLIIPCHLIHNSTIEGTMKIACINTSREEDRHLVQEYFNSIEDFPMTPKIFRLCNLEINGYETKVYDDKWVKIK